MLKTLQNAFKIKEVREKLLYTFFMLVVTRIGSQLPIPGVNTTFFQELFTRQSNDAFGFFNTITGGSFTNMSVFALSITPYITSSIIMQLLTIAIPKLEEMQQEGEDGRKKIAEYTRYLTVALALMQSVAMSIGFGGKGLLVEFTALNVIVAIVTMTAGSAMLMWIGERITENGVGNGISIVLLFNIISTMPSDMITLYERFLQGKIVAVAVVTAVIIVAVIVAMVVFVIILQDAERRIPVQYSKKVVGRKTFGGQSTHIPLKVNTGGVIPVIFASSLMGIPGMIVALVGKSPSGFWGHIINGLNSNNWCVPSMPWYSIGLVVYILLVVLFAYFYTSITFNPIEVADNMKKQGGFIPGIRPGKPTVDYLNGILKNIIFIGAVGLVIVAVIPIFFSGVFGANVSFGGTSLIIIVGVLLETLKQIESMMLVRHYKGFLND